jgi:hypothetical protein
MADGLSRFFPIPLVGAAVLLAVLILLTPNLISAGGGPTAGSLETQAELVIDHDPTGSVTQLYVHGLGDVRYARITVQLDPNVSWPAPTFIPESNWTRTTTLNGTLAIVVDTAANPVAINVTAVYVDPTSTTVWYMGTYVLDVSGGMLSIVPLLPGAAPISPTPLSALPLELLLAASSTGVAP